MDPEVTTDTVAAIPAPASAPIKNTTKKYVELSVRDIITRAGDNIRSGELPEIEALAASIKAEGQLEPIIITPAVDPATNALIDGRFTVVAGHRRLAAIRSLGLTTISALIINADADRRLKLALIENIQRTDMSPLDKAKGIVKLLKNTKLEQQEVAQALGVGEGYISQYVALLELPQAALDMLRDGELTFTHARTLCRLLPDAKAIEDLLFDIGDMTVSTLDAKVSHLVAKAKGEAAEAEADAEDADDGEDKPKKKKRAAKPAPSEKEIEYYVDSDFHPLKKEDIRELMVSYKRKEVGAESAKKREEYRLILKGITLAADLRLK